MMEVAIKAHSFMINVITTFFHHFTPAGKQFLPLQALLISLGHNSFKYCLMLTSRSFKRCASKDTIAFLFSTQWAQIVTGRCKHLTWCSLFPEAELLPCGRLGFKLVPCSDTDPRARSSSTIQAQKSQLQIKIFRPGVSSLWLSTCAASTLDLCPAASNLSGTSSSHFIPFTSLGKADVIDLLTACYTASLLEAGFVQTQEALTSDLSYQWETWTLTAHSSTSSTIWLSMIFLVSNSADEWLNESCFGINIYEP